MADSTPPPIGYRDGALSTPRPIGVVRPRYPYKAGMVSDLYARAYERDYKVLPSRYDANLRMASRTDYTNSALYAEDFTNAAWIKQQCTITAAAARSPRNGATTASALMETAVTNFHDIAQNYTFTTGVWILECKMKRGLGRDWGVLQLYDGTTVCTSFFDLLNGVVGNVTSALASSIEALADGWYKCRIAINAAAGAGGFYVMAATGDGNSSYAGDITKGIYLCEVNLWRYGVLSALYPTIATDPVPMTANLLANSGFETAGSFPDTFASWTEFLSGSGYYFRDGTTFYTGTRSCRYYNPSGVFDQGTQQQAILTAGRLYYVSFWAKIDVADGSIVRAHGNDFVLTTAWARYSCIFSALSANFGLNSRANAGRTIWIDEAYVTVLPAVIGSYAHPHVLTTSAARTASAPDLHATDSDAFLIEETEFELTPLMLAKFQRTFARIPTDRVFYEMRPFSRPSMHGLKSSSYWGISFDDDQSTWLYAVRKTLTLIAPLAADTKAVSGSVTRAGTNPDTKAAFTPDVFGASVISFTANPGAPVTYTFTANDTDANIIATLQGAGTGLTVALGRSPTGMKIIVTAGQLVKASTTDTTIDLDFTTTSITLARKQSSAYTDITQAKAETDTPAVTETYAVPASKRAFQTSGAHGGSAGDYVGFFKGDKIVAISKAITASGVDFACPLEDVDGKDFTADTVVFSSGAAFRYVNGTKDCTIKITLKHSLPGFTKDIATGADVPSVPLYLDGVAWLGVITAGSAYAAIAAPTFESYYREGPIVVKRTEEVQMADALESRDVNA